MLSLEPFQQQAQAALPPEAWAYLQDTAGRGLTAQANRAAFDAIRLVPRVLADMRQASTAVNLFGQSLEHPLLLAPIAYQRLFHADGEQGSAAAADAQGGTMLVSSLASQSLESIAAASERPLWFQLYWQGSRERTLRLLKRAEAAGYAVMLVTVDAPVKQAVCTLPPHIWAVNCEQPLQANPVTIGESAVFQGWMSQAPTWQDMLWLRAQTQHPLLIKGILHPEDAEQAMGMGFDGIIVSNHGGRVLDSVTSSLDALTQVLAQVQGRVPVLFDSGIRSGLDAYKALSLGAAAVCIGRPYVYGLAANGALGVAQVIRLMRDELEMTMALMGQSLTFKA
ncbi:MAG: alpha-hydroxy-acid oxidizing enzyme [Thiotrichales bacterium 32-46-8]|jgi:4-hydroxymandelate oxidase|nr:MAG: alpha-hydroxy-acid oxidizing enzyme [Thiotrichales bacterium 32-46-8]OYY22945.1 MAG: alpha-hydroxy-acid oxidizing enzyme [Thiotrichales bacterium 35-46-9]HQR81731.1 alpha-hydroxy acid oxidase [Thiotrichales bacterium]HQR95075.1 alpha-hydroxy acid oxidase [Thiotrichales bacterium]HQT05164.1 alpha-hydroxy acid oxidase [Thiotrichales bacterium]